MIRRIAAARQRRCYMEIFKLIVKHKVDYTVNRNGVFFNVAPLGNDIINKIDRIVREYSCKSQHRDHIHELSRPAGFSTTCASAPAS